MDAYQSRLYNLDPIPRVLCHFEPFFTWPNPSRTPLEFNFILLRAYSSGHCQLNSWMDVTSSGTLLFPEQIRIITSLLDISLRLSFSSFSFSLSKLNQQQKNSCCLLTWPLPWLNLNLNLHAKVSLTNFASLSSSLPAFRWAPDFKWGSTFKFIE